MTKYIGITAHTNNANCQSLYIYTSDNYSKITNQVLMDASAGFNRFVAGVENSEWEASLNLVMNMSEEHFDFDEAYGILWRGVDNALKSGLVGQESPGVLWSHEYKR